MRESDFAITGITLAISTSLFSTSMSTGRNLQRKSPLVYLYVVNVFKPNKTLTSIRGCNCNPLIMLALLCSGKRHSTANFLAWIEMKVADIHCDSKITNSYTSHNTSCSKNSKRTHLFSQDVLGVLSYL